MSFDGIVVGSGHNGLTCAAYLAKAGLKIAIVERNKNLGGGVCTEEVTLPGFKHNLHGNFHSMIEGIPIYNELELEKYGAKYVYPAIVQAMAYRDGKALIFYRDIKKTVKSFERFSKKDARTVERLYQLFNTKLSRILLASFFSAPIETQKMLEQLSAREAQELIQLGQYTSKEVVDEYFESEYVRVFFFQGVSIFGISDIPGSGALLPATLTRHPASALCVGGSNNLGQALANVVKANGGEIITNAIVRRIVVKNGEAQGVELEGGRILEATRFVASNIDIQQTLDLAEGERNFSSDIVRKVKNWKWDITSLATLHVALNEPPHFSAAKFDPDMDRAWMYIFGSDSTDELAKSFRQLERGDLPDNPSGNGACNTLYDPTLAPTGKHVAFWWPYSVYELREGGAKEWDTIRDTYSEKLLNVWREFAPNMTKENVLAKYLYTPLDIERRHINMKRGDQHGGAYTLDQWGINRPHKDLASYRTTVKKLYLCASSSHPGGGVTFGPGYNAANIIAEDLGIKKWWRPIAG